MALPLVAIVGRPNVGKSSLFNRILGRRRAIVQPEPGVTRDVLEAEAEWAGMRFRLVDTGGLFPPSPEDALARAVEARAEAAAREAELLLFVVDAQAGPVGADELVAERLRQMRRPVIVVANKAESDRARHQAAEFARLGFGEPVPVSALHGLGIEDLLDAVVARIATSAESLAPSGGGVAGERDSGEAMAPPEAPPRVAIVGRPNVGKSSLVNRLLGEARQIVAEVPGTTRDAIDLEWRAGGRSFVLVDTAGLGRPGRIGPGAEREAVRRARRALQRADVALLVVDASLGFTHQDRRIAGLVAESGRATAILCNKWDIAPDGWRDVELWRREVAGSLPGLSHVPVVAVSALQGTGLRRIPGLILELLRAADFRLATAELNRFLAKAQVRQPPPAVGGRPLRIYYGTQTGVRPPTFLLFVNDPARVDPSYARYLENRMREAYPLAGTPIRLAFHARAQGRQDR